MATYTTTGHTKTMAGLPHHHGSEGYGSDNGPGQPSTMYILIQIQQFNVWLLLNAERCSLFSSVLFFSNCHTTT